MDAAVRTPRVSAQLDSIVDSLGEVPELVAAGDALFAELGESPELSVASDAILARASGRFVVALQAIARQHPDWSVERASDELARRVRRNVDGPAFDHALDTALDRLLDAPRVDGMFTEMGQRFFENLQLARRLAESVEPTDWTRQLIEWNGGEVPDRARARELLLERAWTQERIDGFLFAFLSSDRNERLLAQASVDVLRAPSFSRHLTVAVEAFFRDEQVQEYAARVFELLTAPEPAAAELSHELRAAVDRPEADRILSRFLEALLNDPELAVIGGRLMEGLMADPQLDTELRSLLGPSPGPADPRTSIRPD